MNFHPLKTVDIPQWALRKAGVWDECKRRFGVTDEHQFVTLTVGTKLRKQYCVRSSTDIDSGRCSDQDTAQSKD